MPEKGQGKIHIKWVRSGIGFSRSQKRMIRSLGLRRLNQVVERPNSPQVRGLVASIPHLVEIVKAPPPSVWASVPEYTVRAPETPAGRAAEAAPEAVKQEAATLVEPVHEIEAESLAKEPSKTFRAVKREKAPRAAAVEKGKASKATVAKKKTTEKAAKAKAARPAKKGKK